MEQTSAISPQPAGFLAVVVDQLKVILCIYGLILVGQSIATTLPLSEIITGLSISFVIVFFAVILKNGVRRPDLPGFAWATLLSFVLTLPVSPLQGVIVEHIGKLNFMAYVTPLLAFAGISVGDKLHIMRKLSWKLVIVAMLVMASTYFFSALISQTVLSLHGLI